MPKKAKKAVKASGATKGGKRRTKSKGIMASAMKSVKKQARKLGL